MICLPEQFKESGGYRLTDRKKIHCPQIESSYTIRIMSNAYCGFRYFCYQREIQGKSNVDCGRLSLSDQR